VDADTGTIRLMSDEARLLFDIDENENVEAISFWSYCYRNTDRLRIVSRVLRYGIRRCFLALVSTPSGSVFATRMRGKFIDAVYPNYFIIIESYRELALLARR
jgi:hypothetical protein